MNNDQVKRGAPLTDTSSNGGSWQNIGWCSNPQNTPPSAGIEVVPTLTGVFNFTSTPPPVYGGEGGIWDFTTARQAAPWIGADGKCKYRITYTQPTGLDPPNGVQGIWKQNTELNAANAAALIAGYEWVSGDAAMFNTPSHPGNKQFQGLMSNVALQNTTTYPFLLTTPAPNNNIGTGSIPPNNVPPGFPAWMSFGSHCTAQVQDPNLPGQPLQDKYRNYQAAGLDTGGSGTAEQYDFVTIDVWIQKEDLPGTHEIPVNLGLEPNKVNYIWTGASSPTFQYDATRGRVEFIQLQDDNILNEKSIPYAPTVSGATGASSTGQAAGIINSASQDAVYSRNSVLGDIANPISTTPVPNQGIRAEIGGCGIFNIWLCPEDYEPPPTINLSSYWSNKNSGDGTSGEYWNNTEKKREEIIKGCIEASDENWNGSLFARLGFQTHRELLPVYGKQHNRFNPNTYNTTEPSKISRATKPLILCNAVNNTVMPALNTYYTLDPCGNSINGIPMFSNGFLSNESVALDLVPQGLAASSPPILSTSPFLLIESNICQTNWASGSTQKNVLFYLMKNYSAASFIYGYGSSYTHTANQDSVLSLINTAFRDPITGRLQKCSPNSTVIYKIQRDVSIPPPKTTVQGTPLNMEQPQSSTDKLLQELIDIEKSKLPRTGAAATGGGALGSGIGGDGGGGSDDAPGAGAVRQQQATILNSILTNAGATNNIVAGTRAAENMAYSFATIATLNLTPQDQAEMDEIAFIINSLFAGVQVQLAMMEGKVVPEYLTLSPDILARNNAATGQEALAGRITREIFQQLEDLGGIPGLRDIIRTGNYQPILNAGGQIATNPRTNQPAIVMDDTRNNEYSLLRFNDGGQTVAAMAQLMFEALEIQDTDPGDLVTSSINDSRVTLNDPMQEYEPVAAVTGQMIDIGGVRTAVLSQRSDKEQAESKSEGEKKESKGHEEKSMESSPGFQGRPHRGTQRSQRVSERTETPEASPHHPPPRPPGSGQGGAYPPRPPPPPSKKDE